MKKNAVKEVLKCNKNYKCDDVFIYVEDLNKHFDVMNELSDEMINNFVIKVCDEEYLDSLLWKTFFVYGEITKIESVQNIVSPTEIDSSDYDPREFFNEIKSNQDKKYFDSLVKKLRGHGNPVINIIGQTFLSINCSIDGTYWVKLIDQVALRETELASIVDQLMDEFFKDHENTESLHTFLEFDKHIERDLIFTNMIKWCINKLESIDVLFEPFAIFMDSIKQYCGENDSFDTLEEAYVDQFIIDPARKVLYSKREDVDDELFIKLYNVLTTKFLTANTN